MDHSRDIADGGMKKRKKNCGFVVWGVHLRWYH